MTKQNNGLLSPDISNHSTGALSATLFPPGGETSNVAPPPSTSQKTWLKWKQHDEPQWPPEKSHPLTARPAHDLTGRHGSTSRLRQGAAPRAQARAGGSHQHRFAVLRRVVLRTMAVPQPHASAFSPENYHFYMTLKVDILRIWSCNFFLHFKCQWLHLLCHI